MGRRLVGRPRGCQHGPSAGGSRSSWSVALTRWRIGRSGGGRHALLFRRRERLGTSSDAWVPAEWAVGGSHLLVVRAGQAWGAGPAAAGQPDPQSASCQPTLARLALPAAAPVSQVAAGELHRSGPRGVQPHQALAPGPRVQDTANQVVRSCALTVDGTLWTWGSNTDGQLGVAADSGGAAAAAGAVCVLGGPSAPAARQRHGCACACMLADGLHSTRPCALLCAESKAGRSEKARPAGMLPCAPVGGWQCSRLPCAGQWPGWPAGTATALRSCATALPCAGAGTAMDSVAGSAGGHMSRLLCLSWLACAVSRCGLVPAACCWAALQLRAAAEASAGRFCQQQAPLQPPLSSHPSLTAPRAARRPGTSLAAPAPTGGQRPRLCRQQQGWPTQRFWTSMGRCTRWAGTSLASWGTGTRPAGTQPRSWLGPLSTRTSCRCPGPASAAAVAAAWARAASVGTTRAAGVCVHVLGRLTRTVALLQVSCGARHTVVLSASSKLYAWGLGKFGQLGLGHRDQACKPQQVQVPQELQTALAGHSAAGGAAEPAPGASPSQHGHEQVRLKCFGWATLLQAH